MKASEVIVNLAKIIANRGDLEVWKCDTSCGLEDFDVIDKETFIEIH